MPMPCPILGAYHIWHTPQANELQQMIRFGADVVIKSDGASLSEKDIDALISRGEGARQAMRVVVAGKLAPYYVAEWYVLSSPPPNSPIFTLRNA